MEERNVKDLLDEVLQWPGPEFDEEEQRKDAEKDEDPAKDWFRCLGDNEKAGRKQAKQEILATLRDPKNRRKNFMMRLATGEPGVGYPDKNGSYKNRMDLAVAFLRVMERKEAQWREFTYALKDLICDNLLERVKEEGKHLLDDWLDCFHGSDEESVKQEIKNSLSNREEQKNPYRNFIVRLASNYPYGYPDRKGSTEFKMRPDLAVLFLRFMKANPYWKNFSCHTKQVCKEHNIEGAPAIWTALHRQWKFEPPTSCRTGGEAITLLHEAARLGQVEAVNTLIRDSPEQITTTNNAGCTALHCAAMATFPNPKIAGLLTQAMKDADTNLINNVSNKKSGWNTALHIAAHNVHITQEFIDELKEADPTLINYDMDTPFHVAAKSQNPNVIQYMLRTFAPTNNRWDIDAVDDYENRRDKLINICARKGNVEAVSLLIQHGADISLGVLHEIVMESARNPDKIDSLKAVYQAIVDNCVMWRWLEEQKDKPEEEHQEMPLEGSDIFKNQLRETMTWLLRHPLERYKNEDVLQCAISCGASEIFKKIINTREVFRFDGTDRNREVRFDVTCFTTQTTPESIPDKSEFDWICKFFPCQKKRKTEFGPLERGQETQDITQQPESPESIPLQPSDGVEHDKESTRHNFAKPHIPNRPYVTHLLASYDQWKNTNILSTEPVKELTKLHFDLIQRMYVLVGVVHLLFMIVFSAHHTPTICALQPSVN